MEKIVTTNCFVFKNGRLLLGLKKRGFGEGRWNGFGGKVRVGETSEQAARRELLEECGIIPTAWEHAGTVDFEYQGKDKFIEMHIYRVTDFSGEPTESDEMKPQWFELSNIPKEVWPDDRYWFPYFFAGTKFKGNFVFEGYDTILNHNIIVLG